MGSLKKKRRGIVPNIERKRALFSCDRCKKKKTACKRVQPDGVRYDYTTPCAQCSAKGLECVTSMPRKKRFVGPVENVELHYRCLTQLVAGLFPERDIFNLEELVDLGKSFKIAMPDLDATTKRPNKTEDTPRVHRDVRVEVDETIDEDMATVKSEFEDDDDGSSTANEGKQIENETLIVDSSGNTHYIGSTGTVTLLKSLCDIILRKSFNLKPAQSLRELRDARLETITSSHRAGDPKIPPLLLEMDKSGLQRLPMVDFIPREQADYLVEVYFQNVHQIYLVFIESTFRKKYDIFWKELEKGTLGTPNSTGPVTMESPSPSNKLSHAEIGCIYMVWILANRWLYTLEPQRNPMCLEDHTLKQLVDVIKLTLPDIVLTPSVNGIRLIYLLSAFLSSTKVRESAWILVELAITQVRSLGLHRTTLQQKLSSESAEERKRIFWCLIKTRVFSSSSFGRVPGLNGEEMDVSLPSLYDISNNDSFKPYFKYALELSRIMYEIMMTKLKLNLKSDPFSFSNIERTLLVKKRLDAFWQALGPDWQDPYTKPIDKYKVKINVFYEYYHICLTLPFYFHFVNNNNHMISSGEPTMTVLVTGIESAFRITELSTLFDDHGFFNGTISNDIFFLYNAVLVLALTYILFKTNGTGGKDLIDVAYLDENHGINLASLLNALNLVRRIIFRNRFRVDGTMQTLCEVIETILQDLAIVDLLVTEFGAPPRIQFGSKKEEEAPPNDVFRIAYSEYPVPKGFPTSNILSAMPSNVNTPAIQDAMLNSQPSALPHEQLDGEFIDMLLGDLFGSTSDAADLRGDPKYWKPFSGFF